MARGPAPPGSAPSPAARRPRPDPGALARPGTEAVARPVPGHGATPLLGAAARPRGPARDAIPRPRLPLPRAPSWRGRPWRGLGTAVARLPAPAPLCARWRPLGAAQRPRRSVAMALAGPGTRGPCPGAAPLPRPARLPSCRACPRCPSPGHGARPALARSAPPQPSSACPLSPPRRARGATPSLARPPSPRRLAPPARLAPPSRRGRPRRGPAPAPRSALAYPGVLALARRGLELGPARAQCLGPRCGPAACSRRAARRVHSSAPACARLVHGASARPCTRVCSRGACGALARLTVPSARSSTPRCAHLPLATRLPPSPPMYFMCVDHVIYINEMETQLGN
jgi:hypothetical protein